MAMLATAALFAACDDTQEGTEPGGDSQPNVVVYQLTADGDYDADMTTKLRLAVNDATETVYVLAESQADYAAHYNDSTYAYVDYVVDNGTEFAVADNKVIDYNISELGGLNYITAVAVKGDTRKMAPSVTFTGYTYSQVEGTEDYVFTDPWKSVCEAKLYVCNEVPTNYRLKGVCFAKLGTETFDINMSVYTDEDGKPVTSAQGGLTYLRVLAQETPYEYGSYGVVSVRDVAAWQNKEDYVLEYPCVLTSDNELDLILQLYVTAGSLGMKEVYFQAAE